MKNDVNNTTEKLGVSKDEASSSDNKENRNTEIVNISMAVKRWYSVANLIYSLLVGYVWVRYINNRKPSKQNYIKTDWQYFRTDDTLYSVCSES